MIPAMKFASVWRAAKPTIAAAIAPEANRLVASFEMPPKPDSATAIPIRTIVAYTSRRTKRSRVAPSRESPVRSAAACTARARNARSSRVAIISASRIEAPALIHGSTSMRVSGFIAAAQPRAILFDALGTLIGFEPPAPHLRDELRARGFEVTPEAAHSAIRAEIAYYRAHLHEGSGPEALAELRQRCAEAMLPALPAIPVAVALDALLASLRFFPYPDSVPTLLALRAAGIRTAVVSNWDWGLHERLAETGLTPLLAG